MGFKPTEEQVEPVRLAKEGCNLVLKAFAGTGKSTTLNFIAEELRDRRILYTTFGKENIVSARKKFPKNVTCLTAHSLAFKYVDSKIGLYDNGLLTPNLGVRDVFEAMNIKPARYWGSRERQITRVTMAINIINQFCKSTDSKICEYHLEPCQKTYLQDEYDKEKDSAFKIAKSYWRKVSAGKARMTHDMYLKLWHISKPELDYDVILFDEAQDADQLMIDVVKAQKAQLIAVGDRHQQIYAFRGAVNALDEFNIDTQLNLTQSFRYGPRVADLANELLFKHKSVNPGIKGSPMLKTRIERYYAPHDVIIGRTLISLFREMFKMQENNFTDFACLGDNEAMLNTILAIAALKNGKRTFHPFISTFDSYKEFEVYCEHAQSETIPTYHNIVKQHSLPKVIELLEMLGSKRQAQVVFLTAHKCKGLEFNNVTLLNDFVTRGDDNWVEEETNLAYVAATRAMKTLNIGDCAVFDDIGIYQASKTIR